MPRKPLAKKRTASSKKSGARKPVIKFVVTKPSPIPASKKYIPQKRLIELIKETLHPKKWHKITWKKFESFSRLPETKTVLLWNRHNPLNMGSNFRAKHPLMALLLANKIFLERNKTLKQIAQEVSELLSVRIGNPFPDNNLVSTRISHVLAWRLNKYLDIRKRGELDRGKPGSNRWGGKRPKLPGVKRVAILNDIRHSRLSIDEIKTRHNVRYTTVYGIGVAEGIYKPKITSRTYHRTPDSTKARVRELLLERRSIEFITKELHVSKQTVASERKALNKESSE